MNRRNLIKSAAMSPLAMMPGQNLSSDVAGHILCERCAAIVAEEEREERAFAAAIPPHLKLYDFGDSVTVMPIPDMKDEGTYLSTSIAFLQNLEGTLFLGFEIKCKNRHGGPRKSIIDSTDILERLAEAVKRFDAEAATCLENASRKVTHGL